MIDFKHTDVYGFQHAIRGARNSHRSWGKSDSDWVFNAEYQEPLQGGRYLNLSKSSLKYKIGEADLGLLHRLHIAGSDHAKYLRQIQVWVDINAPLYWWKEMDQYKVGQTTNSESTMHSIHVEEFTMDSFSHEHLDLDGLNKLQYEDIPYLEHERLAYNDNLSKGFNTVAKQHWWNIIQHLPSSYNQNRTDNLNYEVLANAYHSRKGHRLDEWESFRKWCETLPYFKEIVGD